MRARLIVLSLGLLAAGCGTSETNAGARASASLAPTGSPASTAAPDSATATATATAIATGFGLASAETASGGARSVEASTDQYKFAYAYPPAAGAIGGVREDLDGDLATMRRALGKEAGADAVQAKTSGYPFNPHETDVTWKVVSDLPGWLSLSAQVYTFSGGAHGMTSFRTLLWDKRANIRRAPLDLFASAAALRAAVKPAFCAALDRERARRREGADIGDGVPEFKQCTDPASATIILGSSDRRAFDRIGFLIEPYAAGPYAEGTYEITLPVTSAMVQAVRPEYRAAFAAP